MQIEMQWKSSISGFVMEERKIGEQIESYPWETVLNAIGILDLIFFMSTNEVVEEHKGWCPRQNTMKGPL